MTTAASLERIARLGVIPVPQGRFVGELGDGMLAALGERRAADTYRLASFLRAGVVLPGSSDRPVVDGRPLLGIADMVARRTESGPPFAPDEALSVEEAMRCYTRRLGRSPRGPRRDRGTLACGQARRRRRARRGSPRRSSDPSAIAEVARRRDRSSAASCATPAERCGP